MKKGKIITGLVLLLLAGSVNAQQRHELTVREAVDMAFKNVIQVKNAEIDYRIQEAQNKEIFGRALPQVSANVGTQYYIKLPQVLFPQSDASVYNVLKNQNLIPQSTAVPDPILVPFSFQQPWNLALGATVQQLLFQPEVFVGLQARKTALNLSAAILEQTKEGVKDSAYRRYYAILIAEEQLDFIDTSIKRLEKLYRDDSIMYVNGFAERLDLDRVQVQLNNLRTNRNIVANAVTISYAALKFSIGVPQEDTVVLKETISPETLKDGLLETGFTYEDRAEIRTLQVSRELQQLDVKRNKLAGLPTAALAGNYSVNGQGQKFFTDNETRWLKSLYVGLNISVPIFDGFQRKYRTQQSQLRVDKIDNNIINVKQVIDLQRTISQESLKSALLNLDVQERNQQLAQRVYNATKLKFEEGLGSSFEVLQADTDFQTAQFNYFNALYNATVARIGYQSSLGKLQ
ncbi:MAG TPA: TolC family protein [Flavisolibacter sp.]|nr:TolC family protein [Flavisolibacter sp.]